VVQRLTKGGRGNVGSPKNTVQQAMEEYWSPEAWAELEASDGLLPTLDARTRRRHGQNHLVYMRWRDRTADEVVAWHRLVHEHVVTALEEGPDVWFTDGVNGSARPGLSREAVSALGHHSDHHLRDIRRALAAQS
jgi:hypothetical protein